MYIVLFNLLLFCSTKLIYPTKVSSLQYNIGAAFRGMHVSPVKHSYARLPRKCDYWTDRQDTRMDRQMPDKVIPMCRYTLHEKQKCLWNTNAPAATSPTQLFFIIKGMVKVTRSLGQTLVSIKSFLISRVKHDWKTDQNPNAPQIPFKEF